MSAVSPPSASGGSADRRNSPSQTDKRAQVMGGRTRKCGCTCHVPICTSFGEKNPFHTKIQQDRAAERSMTQDHVSLRKGMSSQTSYASVARAVEAKHKQEEQERRAKEIDDTPRGNHPAPKLTLDQFGNSPDRVKYVSGFSGHRQHSAFVTGRSVNNSDLEEWRNHVFEKEVEAHKSKNHFRHLTEQEAAEVRESVARGDGRAQGGMVISLPNRATAAKRPN